MMKKMSLSCFILAISLHTLAQQSVTQENFPACSTEEYAKKLCFSAKAYDTWGGDVNMPCEDQTGFENQKKIMLHTFQLAPAWMQGHLCALNKVLLHRLTADDKDMGIASWSDPTHLTIGIPLDVFDNESPFSLTEELTRQMTWGKSDDLPSGFGFDASTEQKTDFPSLELSILTDMGHEMGHIIISHTNHGFTYFDAFSNFKIAIWNRFSWSDNGLGNGIDFGAVKPGINNINISLWDFFNDESLKAIKKTPVTPAQVNEALTYLFGSDFVSPFALASPNEDFCETVAWKLLAEVVGSWKFNLLNGKSVDVMANLLNPQNAILKEKINFANQRINDAWEKDSL